MKERFLIFVPLLLSGCATVTADSDQAISVTTTPAGAHCVLKNNVGMWEIEKTPGSAKVDRSYSPLIITCDQKKKTGKATLDAETRGRAYGNILLLGVPAIVDASTGAGYEYDPDSVDVSLSSGHR